MTTQHDQKQTKESRKDVEKRTSIAAITVIAIVMISIEIARLIV